MKNKVLFLLIITFLFLSCNKDRFKIDTDDILLDVKIERFDQDLMQIDTSKMDDEIHLMDEKYGDFFKRFVSNVVMFASPNKENLSEQLKGFVSDSMVQVIYNESQLVFGDVSAIQEETQAAFKYIKYYFPDKKIPRVAMHISGFNQSIVATEDIISISIDNYLGADFVLYKNVAYDYQLKNMTPDKVAPDIFLGYLMTEFPYENNRNLLSGILSRAKILYLQGVCMPNRSEADLMGFSNDQIAWCAQNEKNMWTYIVENKHLYNSSQLVCSKYLNPSPFTSYFSNESPGQAAIWLGLQIIKSYMNANTSISLNELMNNQDYQNILEQSNYKP